MDVNKVYKTQLLRNYWHLGLPLRNGRPVQSGTHTQEILIGDVGWQSRQDSSFHVLFNAIDPALHPDLPPPKPYEPFPISPSRTPEKWRMLHHFDAAALPAGPIRSTSITKVDFQASASTPGSPLSAGLHVTCSKDRGALLVLHHPADHAHLEPCPEAKAYVRRHFQSWYDHAKSLGLGLEMGELVFVTAWYKTSKWDTFTFTSKSHDVQLSLQGSAPAAADLSIGMSFSSGTYSDVHQLFGPAASGAIRPRGRVFSSLYVTAPTAGGSAVCAESDSEDISRDITAGDDSVPTTNQCSLARSQSEPMVDQCLFIQGYIPYKHPLFPSYLRAAAGPHDLGGPSPDPATSSSVLAAAHSGSDSAAGSETDFGFLVEPPRAYDPLVEALSYISERNPNADVAVAHHRDLLALFSGYLPPDEWPENFALHLEQLPESTVTTFARSVFGYPASLPTRVGATSHHAATHGFSAGNHPLAEVPIVQNAVASPATLAAAQARRITNANFVCESCGSAFTREFNLKSHINSHYGERPYACQYCERAFNRAHDCRRHEERCEHGPGDSSAPGPAGEDSSDNVSR